MNRYNINVFSEIGKLRTVLVHRPGQEVENLTPALLERLLFDDIPFLKVAQEEHDAFVKKMKNEGVNTLYIEKLVAETLDLDKDLKLEFLKNFLTEAKVKKEHYEKLRDYFLTMTTIDMVNTMIAGVETITIGVKNSDNYPFVCDPLPNILFQRDPFATIFNGICLNQMWSVTRNRETLFIAYVLEHHPAFKGQTFFYNRNDKYHIEGGDIMVLNKNTLVIGLSSRTEIDAVRLLTKRIFESSDNQNLKIVGLDLPKSRSFMHLDTVMTSIDHDKFIVHPLIFDYLDQFKIIEFTRKGEKTIAMEFEAYISQLINRKAILIRCGGKSQVASAREQWNDGTNVLTISPGKVIAYSRNHVTNQMLRDIGVEVILTPSSELSRGRGGPRCMTMPIVRDNLK